MAVFGEAWGVAGGVIVLKGLRVGFFWPEVIRCANPFWLPWARLAKTRLAVGGPVLVEYLKVIQAQETASSPSKCLRAREGQRQITRGDTTPFLHFLSAWAMGPALSL